MIRPRHYNTGKIFTHSKTLTLCLLLMAACSINAPRAHGQQPSPPPPPATTKAMRLNKIEFVGLQRYTQEQAVNASGLKTGQAVEVAMLDEAANRLLSSGLFAKLSYRYRTSGEQAVVTFQVEEMKGGVPVVFDNFIWFSNEELLNAIRQEVPAFDGTAPESGGVTDTITRVLQRLLDERKISGQVDYTPSADMSGANPEHIFSVKNLKIPICTLHFTGTAAIDESELVKSSKLLLNTEYSQKFVQSFAKTNLIPLYRQRGHLRAVFNNPSAQPEAQATCRDGAAVTLPVQEGVAYNWDKAEWTGNAALGPQDLDGALGMKPNELANGLKIDEGLGGVQIAYGRRGFIKMRFKAAPEFDDAGKRVAYRFQINEGAQYHMGTVSFTGLADSNANRLKAKWKLREGDVYDATYMNEYVKTNLRDVNAIGFLPKKFDARETPDSQKMTVDVTFEFKR